MATEMGVEPVAVGAAAARPVGAPRVGEVIDATTTEFTAQSYRLHESPFFGSFVRASTGDCDVWGVVARAHTGGFDQGRLPVARGERFDDEEEVYRQSPELPQLLRTQFTALVVGYCDGARGLPSPAVAGAMVADRRPRHMLPPRPPRVHAFVYAPSAEEVVAFTASLRYLDAILRLQTGAPVDELVAAAVRAAAAARSSEAPDAPRAYLLTAARYLAVQLGREPARLVALLRRLGG